MGFHSLALTKYLHDLGAKYLPSTESDELQNHPGADDFETRSFSVLAHAAFEQFFEDVAVNFGANLLNHWQTGKLMDRELIACIGCIVASAGNFLVIETDESKVQEAPVHQFSKIFRKQIIHFRNAIDDNNGASLKYLRKMFGSLGLNIDPDPSTQSALALIARNRGTFAHRRIPQIVGKFAHKPITASDILKHVALVGEFCCSFEKSLNAMFKNLNICIRVESRQELITATATAIRQIAVKRSASQQPYI